MTANETLKEIQSRWYAEERSPISLDNKWFMDLETLAKELLKENEKMREALNTIRSKNALQYSNIFNICDEALRP